MYMDSEKFENWMERIMERFDRTEKLLERVLKKNNTLDGEEVLDNQDLCLLLKVGIRTLQRYRAIGVLPYFTISGKVFYRAKDVNEFIRNQFAAVEERAAKRREKEVRKEEKIKQQIFYISDGGYFPQGYTAADLKDFYREYYPDFMTDRYSKLMDQFHLDEKRRISSYSKGMKKQLLVIMGISAGTKYLLCDETFDGLDPVMRQAVKSLFVSEIMNRDFTPVIASHNMRELEDVCDHVGFLHKGGILLSRELEDMKFHIHKIQCVLPDQTKEEALLKELDVLKKEHQGSLLILTARGTREEILQKVQTQNPIFCEVIPLTLEEIFISETEVAGYEVKNIFW